MQKPFHQRERKVVPRFRRKNENKNNVDFDDEEAQALIEKDLQSHFKWNSDTNEEINYQFDNLQDEVNYQQISFNDQINEELSFDIDNNNQHLWNINIQDNDHQKTKWTDDQQHKEISLNIHSIQDQQQQWSLNDQNNQLIQLNLIHQDDQINKHDLDTNQNQQLNFIQGEEFIQKMKFGIDCSNEETNNFQFNEEDNERISFDSDIPSIDSHLSIYQDPIIIKWIEGISQYKISFPVDKLNEEYSPLSQLTIQIDSTNLKSLKWSLDLLKDNLLKTYLLSLPDNQQNQYSIPDRFNLNLSTNDENVNQIYSINDENSSKQIISLSTNDIKDQLLSIIDFIERKQNFGCDDHLLFYQFYLNDFKNLILNLSPEEFFNSIYSPNDAKQILLENLLIESDEISTRAFRRYRCKHMSIKIDEKDQLDSQQGLNLQFKGNELIAIGEQQIQNDLDQQIIPKDITNNEILLNDHLIQIYDIETSDSIPINLGPCLYRSNYERRPPATWSRLRREIGYISYDASLKQPIYYLDKSFKRFLHIPIKRDKCSFNVYNGYQQFIDKLKSNSENYFLPFDSTDLRPLLYWYSNKQNLFSTKTKSLLKPPTFICRRLVLRTILANLYCDSDPWKLLVVRIKGQFYLALANKQSKKVEDMTKDEYSGYKFEDLFTTDQPNTTRLKENIPLNKPQQQFHTVQYWQFGDFNILYSNEIDGEIKENNQQNTTQSQTNKQVNTEDLTTSINETIKQDPITIDNSECKSPETDWWNWILHNVNECESLLTSQTEIQPSTTSQIENPSDESIQIKDEIIPIENPNEEIEDESKQAQIQENLELIKDDENEIIEKKKRFENELKNGYVEMKCTNKKIFYRDENKLQTLHWWAQMWLANINTLMIGYKSSNDGIVDQIDLFSIHQLISKFLSKYDLHLKYCLSYLYSFLELIQKTVHIDDPNTIHAFTYIPQPLEIDPQTGKPVQVDLPNCVPFRYTQIKRSNQRHNHFMPDWYLQEIQRTIPIGGILQENQCKTIEQEMKKRFSHRGRSSCPLKQQQQNKHQRKKQK